MTSASLIFRSAGRTKPVARTLSFDFLSTAAVIFFVGPTFYAGALSVAAFLFAVAPVQQPVWVSLGGPLIGLVTMYLAYLARKAAPQDNERLRKMDDRLRDVVRFVHDTQSENAQRLAALEDRLPHWHAVPPRDKA